MTVWWKTCLRLLIAKFLFCRPDISRFKSCAHIKLNARWNDWFITKETVPPCLCCFRIKRQFLLPDLMLHSNLSAKYSQYPKHFTGIHAVRAWQGGEGTVSGCEKKAAAQCSCVSSFRICMTGWVGLVYNSDVILPGLSSVPTLTQPTGSCAAVSQLLSRSLPPMHVCLCVFCPGSLLICCTFAPPYPSLLSGDMNFGSNEL